MDPAFKKHFDAVEASLAHVPNNFSLSDVTKHYDISRKTAFQIIDIMVNQKWLKRTHRYRWTKMIMFPRTPAAEWAPAPAKIDPRIARVRELLDCDLADSAKIDLIRLVLR